MKGNWNRVFALCMALMLCVSAIGGMALTANAEETTGEEITRTNSYVLTYNGNVEGYTYGSVPYMYKSPFKMRHAYNDPAAGPNSVWEYTYTNEIFQLVNTSKLAEGGEGAYASIPVYCTDVDTGTTNDSNYRRINLEDSTYHASGAAAKLRAVILNSFPYIQDMETIANAANGWLLANGRDAISDLQIGETMLATQQAIWMLTHGEKYAVVDPYTGCGSFDGSDAVYQINAEETEKPESTRQNIIGLRDYLLSLNGMAPKDDAISDATFEKVTYNAVKAEDGSYCVSVHFTVNTSVGAGDALTLSATCDGNVQSVELTSGGTYSFTFEGLAERKEVKLELNGYQVGGDVYLFDSEGDRSTSQSMIGYDDSRLPVHGEIIATPDRILNIYKTTGKDEGQKPLANIEFDIYKVASMQEIEAGEVTLGEKPTVEEIQQYQTSANYITTLKTDVQGFAALNFTQAELPDGVYLVAEKFSPATTGPVEPFFVIVPATTEDGDGYSYTITVNPKNTTETKPDIKKDVTKIENNSDSFDVNEPHTWIIRGDIPAGIGSAEKYVITDTIDYRLTYTKGSPVVKLYNRDGEEITMIADMDYVLTEGNMVVDGNTVDHFSVSLTKAGMQFVVDNLGSDKNTPEIRVYFNATINSNASMGTEIPNQAHLDYTNSAGVDYDSDSDIPEVYTGGTNILKTDVDGIPLSGAVFKIVREATEAEIQDGSILKEKLTVGEKDLTVVFESFYDNVDLEGEKVAQVTTNEDGKAVIYGLAYGEYYLVEIKAPSGYNLLTAPIQVVINQYSHYTGEMHAQGTGDQVMDNTIKVINTKFILPDTGGIGTTVFTVTGTVLLGSAAILLLTNKKRTV